MKLFKLGGSILATAAERENIINVLKRYEDEKIIVVCSAMGRNGFPYATDTLKNLIKNNSLKEEENAILLSSGEIISALLFTSECRNYQLNAVYIDIYKLGILTDDNYLDANCLSMDVSYIEEMLKKYQVLVVSGFIGFNQQKSITLLGKGGSDYTAIIIAKYLHLKEVYLLKDVNGIYPSYPLIGKKMMPFSSLNYQEMIMLNDLGYGIIQKKAVALAEKEKIKICLRHYLDLSQGTDVDINVKEHECVGFFIDKNDICIASNNPKKVYLTLEDTLKKHHIFIKEYQLNDKKLIINLPSSQVSVVRKLLIELYFDAK